MTCEAPIIAPHSRMNTNAALSDQRLSGLRRIQRQDFPLSFSPFVDQRLAFMTGMRQVYVNGAIWQ